MNAEAVEKATKKDSYYWRNRESIRTKRKIKEAAKDSYYWRNREKILAILKEKRKITEEGKSSYYSENREKRCAYMREYRRKNQARLLVKKRVYMQEYYLKNRERLSERARTYQRKSRLLRLYSLTEAQYRVMLKKQNFTCAICHRPERTIHYKSGRPYALAVDHCHHTGRVRGLLCVGCNNKLGMVENWYHLYKIDIFSYLRKES